MGIKPFGHGSGGTKNTPMPPPGRLTGTQAQLCFVSGRHFTAESTLHAYLSGASLGMAVPDPADSPPGLQTVGPESQVATLTPANYPTVHGSESRTARRRPRTASIPIQPASLRRLVIRLFPLFDGKDGMISVVCVLAVGKHPRIFHC